MILRHPVGHLIMLCFLAAASAVAGSIPQEWFKSLPPGVTLVKTEFLEEEGLRLRAAALQAPGIKSIRNTVLRAHGRQFHVEIFEATEKVNAKRLRIAVVKEKSSFAFVQGNQVVAFYDIPRTQAIKFSYDVGFFVIPKRVHYRLNADIATVNKSDYMVFNRLCSVLNKAHARPNDASLTAEVRKLSQTFTFGKSLTLRSPALNNGTYAFIPAPSGSQPNPPQIIYPFDSPKTLANVPWVHFDAKLTVANTGFTADRKQAPLPLRAATEWWPTEDAEVVKLVAAITKGETSNQEKIQAINEWLKPWKNVKPTGMPGSRWGVKTVLKNRIGHCWDRSDCFVTFARAAGIPCRQVGGWIYGLGGHIWSEYLIEGKGWQQIDPGNTCDMINWVFYIPYFTTEDGDMPILYVTFPKIDITKTDN